MTQYPLLPDYPLSHPVDPNAPSGPYVPILYHVDADTQRFISPLTWRPPLMAQALPHIRFSAITTFKIKPYSNRVPLIIDTQSLVLVRIADRDRTPVHSTYATASEEGYYTVTLDLVDLPANDSEGQGFIELSINDVVLLSDRCTLGTALWPYDEQPRFPYETIYNVEGGSMVFTSTPSMYQLPPVPSTQPELDLTVTPSGSTVTNKLLFYSEAPSLIINVDGATLEGDYVGPGWYCALMVEENATITLHLSQLTDLYTESINAVRGFNPILVEDEWPTYGRRDAFYIHATTREARIWTGGEWYPVGSSDYKYAPKSDALPLPTGTASKGIEEKYAAGDHVHPFSIELTTNHLDTAFTTPTDTHVPSSKLVKDTIDQVQSDLEEDMITLTGEINATLSTKVDNVTGKGLSTNDLTDELLETLEGSEQKFNKDLNFDTPTNGRYPSTLAVSTALDGKVDKVTGKGLSTNDLTNARLNTLNGSEQTSNKATTLATPDNTKYPTTSAVSTALNGKVDKVTGKGLSTNDLTNTLVTTINGSERTSNKATTLAAPNNTKYPSTLAVSTALNGKVDKVTGKGLSTNDLTDELLETLEGSEQKFNKDLNFNTPTDGRYPSTLAVSTAINSKVDKANGKGLSTNDLTDELMGVISGAEQQGNKVDNLLNPGATDYPSVIAVNGGLSTKVDKVAGKGLSTNDLTNTLVTTINGSEQTSNKATTLANPDNTKYPSTLAVSTGLSAKVDKVEGKGLSTNDLTNTLVITLNGSEQTSNKATTLSTPDNIKYPSTLAVSTGLSTKVDKVTGKVLSDNNYTTEEKNKLASAIISLPDASLIAKGVIELATSEEVTTGEDATRAVVPSTLKTELDKKVDKETGYSLSKNDLTDDRLITLNGSEQTSNKATTLANPDNTKYPTTSAVSTALNGKVDKVTGKGLSTNDYTTAEKNKLASALTSLPNATTEEKGIIELATGAEVTAGTLTDRAVVPSTLKVELDKKVDKVTGKGLSTNDLTNDLVTTINGSEQTSNKATTLANPDNTKYPTTSAVSTALSTKVDKVTGKTLSTNDYTAEEKNKVATIQNETLTTINSITAEIEPWSRSRWTIQGDCEFTLAEGWNDTGMETAYILLTVRSGALLAGPSSVIFDNSLDQGEGVYEVELVNLDGVIHFRWTSCQIFNAISFRVTTTTPSQTYTLTSLGLLDVTDIGWGDGMVGSHTGVSPRAHVYATPGTYEVRILPAENIVSLNLQGSLVSEVNSEDLKAASNMETLRLMNLTNATGVIDAADMTDWPMTQHFYLYKNPLLSVNVDSAHMVGWNPTVIYISRLTNGNITINTENMAGWTNLENIVLEVLPTLGGSLDTLHFAGWSNLKSITLYELSAAFSVRFHTEDLIELPIEVLHLFDYDGRNTVINTADLSTKAVTYFRLYKLPLSVVTVNSADMILWDLSYLAVSTMPQATGTIDFADLAGSNIVSFGFIDCPLITFIEDQNALLSWTSLVLFQISNCTFSTEQMDRTLYYLYTAAPYRTVTEGIISFGGTTSSAPSGTYEAPDCPVTSSTPGRGIAYALKNDSCSLGFNKWATVTIK